MKLLGNSAYGKTITNLDTHTDVHISDANENEMRLYSQQKAALPIFTDSAVLDDGISTTYLDE